MVMKSLPSVMGSRLIFCRNASNREPIAIATTMEQGFLTFKTDHNLVPNPEPQANQWIRKSVATISFIQGLD